MNPRRFAISAAVLFGTAILVGGVIAAVAGFGMADVKNTHGGRIDDRASEKREISISNADAVSAATAVTAITEAALPDGSQRSAAETVPVRLAAVSAFPPRCGPGLRRSRPCRGAHPRPKSPDRASRPDCCAGR